MVTLAAAAAPTRTLTLTRTIKAPIGQVYKAFTDQDAIDEWLADTSNSEAVAGGHILLTWQGGRHAFGNYTALDKDARVAFNWREGETESQLEALLTSQGDSTQLALNLSGVEESARGEWEGRLDVLQLVLEDGADLRITGRVILGIYPSDFDEKIAAKMGIPTKDGVRVGNLIPGYSAEAAGIIHDDVIVGVNGQTITDHTPLSILVKGNRPGDTVQVMFYRQGQQQTIPVTLKGYPLPEAVSNFGALADRLTATFAVIDDTLADAFKGASEAAAARQPAPKEWSANEVLAHLILSERWQHNWLGTLMETPQANGWSCNHPARIAAVIAVYPTSADLLAELRRAHAETVALIRSTPAEEAARKSVLWHMNFQVDGMAKHSEQHVEQIRDALKT